MKEQKLVRIVVFENRFLEDIPTPPDEFMAFWQEKIDLIPQEFRCSGRAYIEPYPFGDSSSLFLEISFERPETEEEAIIRTRNEIHVRERTKARELSELAILQAKYGADTK